MVRLLLYEACKKCGKWKIPEGKTIDDVGYTIYDYHRAVLFKMKEEATATLDGSVLEKKRLKGRISFFKRLSISKGNVAATFEDIIIAVNPNVQKGIVGAISPPYSDAIQSNGSGIDWSKSVQPRDMSYRGVQEAEALAGRYSSNPDNIGNLGDKKRKAKPS